MRFLFIISHLGGGSGILSKIFQENPRLRTYETDVEYHHPSTLWHMTYLINQTSHIYPGTTYFDRILYNHQFTCKELHSWCKFIYLVREPLESLSHIILSHGYSPDCALNYYAFRLRRICEMARKTSGLLLNYDKIPQSGHSLEKFLELKAPLDFTPFSYHKEKDVLPLKIQLLAKEKYDKYWDFLTRTFL